MAVPEAVHGLVLAGGKSRRMGSDKALLLNGGETQLARAFRLLDAHTEKVFVSARASQSGDSERGRFPQIVDQYEDMGPLAGILSAMEAGPSVSWLVLACDLPNIDDATISYLLQQASPRHPFTAYRSSSDDLPEPLCAVYRPEAADIVRSFAKDGINCPRKILIRSDTHLLQQPNPQALDNVNTPEDLERSQIELAS